MIKKLLLLTMSVLTISLTAQGAAVTTPIKASCVFYDMEDSSYEGALQIESEQWDFDEVFNGPTMPYIQYIRGGKTDLFIVDNVKFSDSNGAETPFPLFVSGWLGAQWLSAESVSILGQMNIPVQTIQAFRIAFSTDLYHSFLYAEIAFLDGSVSKLAMAGLSIGACQ